MSKEIELRPCPNCMAAAEMITTSAQQYYVQCGGGWDCPVRPENWCVAGTQEASAAAWNTRPLEEELERTIAALTDAVQFALASADFAANMNAREAEARLRSLIGETL